MNHFPAITLPTVYQPSALINWFRETRYVLEALHLLRQLDPKRAAGLTAQDDVKVAKALHAACAARFPMQDLARFDDGYLDAVDFMTHGIFVELYGLALTAGAYETGWAAIDLAAATLNEDVATYTRMYGDFKKIFTFANLRRSNGEDGFAPNPITITPPRGRVWRREWATLPLLADYAQNATGYAFLDYSEVDFDETGEYPPWEMSEIKSLTRQWQQAKPLYEQLMQFVKWVGNNKQRLVTLHLALREHAPTLLEITEPKQKRARTLAQIWK